MSRAFILAVRSIAGVIIRVVTILVFTLMLPLPSWAQGRPFSEASMSGTYVFQFRGHSSSTVTINGLAFTAFLCSVSGADPSPCNPAACLLPKCIVTNPTARGAATLIQTVFPIPTPRSGRGTVDADGNGNIVSGSGACDGADLVLNPPPADQFIEQLTFPFATTFSVIPTGGAITNITGTYTVNPDGTGTMTLNTVGDPHCTGTTTFSLTLAGAGKVGVFGFSNPNANPGGFPAAGSGSFMKQ